MLCHSSEGWDLELNNRPYSLGCYIKKQLSGSPKAVIQETKISFRRLGGILKSNLRRSPLSLVTRTLYSTEVKMSSLVGKL